MIRAKNVGFSPQVSGFRVRVPKPITTVIRHVVFFLFSDIFLCVRSVCVRIIVESRQNQLLVYSSEEHIIKKKERKKKPGRKRKKVQPEKDPKTRARMKHLPAWIRKYIQNTTPNTTTKTKTKI